MARELSSIPFSWQEHVGLPIQELIQRRRYRYVANAKMLEEEGFRPITQVTEASGRLLRRGDRMVQYMVEARVRRDEEEKIRKVFPEKELEIRSTPGTVVPVKELDKITTSQDFRASRRGFTLYIRETQTSKRVDLVQELGLQQGKVQLPIDTQPPVILPQVAFYG